MIAGEAEERTLGVENRLRTRIEDLLANVVGAGKARVQVSVELDLERSTKTAETFDPDGQVVRSTQTRELANSSSDGAAAEGVTVANELPGGSEQSDGAATTREQASTTEETTNYEISKTSETTISEAGGIKRLSVAVVVDGTTSTTAPATSTYSRAHGRGARADPRARPVGRRLQRRSRRPGRGRQHAVRRAARSSLTEGTADPGLFDFTRDDLHAGRRD